MPAPYDYGVAPIDPFASVISGLKFGAGIADIQAAQQERQFQQEQRAQQQQQRQLYAERSAAYIADPSEKTLAPLLLVTPKEVGQNLMALTETAGKTKVRQQLESALPIASALRSGNTETALSEIDRLIEATENSGKDAKALRDMRRLAELSPNAVIASTALLANQAGFPDLSKQLLEAGKQSFRILTPEETKTMLGSGAEGVWGVDKDNKPVQVVKPEAGFVILDSKQQNELGITVDPNKAIVQKNTKTGEIKVQNIGPMATATASAGVKLPEPAKALLKIDEDQVASLVGNANIASTFAREAAAIEQLLRGKGGGKLVQLSTTLKSSLGIEDDTVTADTLARSLQTRGATQLRAPGSGSTTDFEMRAFLDSFPQLSQTESGRKLIAKYSQKFAERQRKLGDRARDLLIKNEYSLEAISAYDNSLGTLFDDDIKALIGGGARPYQPRATPTQPVQSRATPAQRNIRVDY